MKDPFTYPDVERLMVDYLTSELADIEPDVTCGVGVPRNWTSSSEPHLQVVCDGVPAIDHPVVAHTTVRLVARAQTSTDAKRIAAVALGLVAAHPGGDGVANTNANTGPLPARDPNTGAELASTTARVTVRSIPITPVAS